MSQPNHPCGDLVVYGLGVTGQKIVDELVAEKVDVALILDHKKRDQRYRDIPISALEDIPDSALAGKSILIGLHNHYVDINRLHSDLAAAGAARILTPINLPQLISNPRTQPGYWLDWEFDYSDREPNFARVRELLADEKSRELLDTILRYRRSGDLTHCPVPSLDDEYTPRDLPRFAGPLRLIDCGAFTGVAIHKFLKAGYAIESFVAFEPDPENFTMLASRDFPVERRLCLPLGTWSQTKQFKFASEGSMGSRLAEAGAMTVQCAAVDDLLRGEPVNLVKMDVEGAEVETLRGMERLIRIQRPNLLLSAYHTPGHLHEIAELVASWQLGYRFHLRVHEYNTFGIVLYCLRDDLLDGQA